MQTIPLFPLRDLVLFPGEVLPLHIFEHRYRQMIADIAKQDSKFGVINLSNGGVLTRVGCIAEVIEMEKLDDGRFNIIALGIERFTLVKEQKDKDYPLALTSRFEEKPNLPRKNIDTNRASSLLFEVLQLTARLKKFSLDHIPHVPKDATELSFWIASSLPTSQAIKQNLLEMDDTYSRIEKEIIILAEIRNLLRASVAIDSAFEHVL